MESSEFSKVSGGHPSSHLYLTSAATDAADAAFFSAAAAVAAVAVAAGAALLLLEDCWGERREEEEDGGRFVGVVGCFIDLGLVSLPHLAVAAASFAGGRLAGQDHPPHLLAHGDRVVCLLQNERTKKDHC